jgi:hypothetical protein
MLTNVWVTVATDTNLAFAEPSICELSWLTISTKRGVYKVWTKGIDSSYGVEQAVTNNHGLILHTGIWIWH